MEFKGTKGEWEAVGDAVFVGDNIIASVFDGKSEEHIPMDNEMMEANAQLIAAAPELLEALEEFVRLGNKRLEYGHFRETSAAVEKGQKAINKALGH